MLLIFTAKNSMNTLISENPFSLTYRGPLYFCDRQDEASKLINNMKNGYSTTLISIRRIGKTGLLHHTFNQLPKGWKGIYIDILETENLQHFLNILATGILNANPEKSSLGRKIWELIKLMRPTISFDSLTGSPQASFDIRPHDVETNINTVFQFLDNQNFKVVLAIDEFQQITNYPEKNTDAWLRTRIQQLKNVVFIFSGSQQHLMAELFASPKRPFFKSTQMLKLDKIRQDIYCDYIISMFNMHKKQITNEIANEILEWSNCHTFYVQQLCNRVFAEAQKTVTSDIWKQQAFNLLKEQEIVFFAYRNMLTNPQWQLLKAIAYDGTVYMPTSSAFIKKHQLGTSATVLRSLKTLLDYELIYSEYNDQGEKYYSVYDVWFQCWCKVR
jgi:uncharacterized protein